MYMHRSLPPPPSPPVQILALNKADALLGEGGVLPDPAEWVSIHEEVTTYIYTSDCSGSLSPRPHPRPDSSVE